MFESILTNTVSSITVSDIALCLVTAIGCGLMIALSYRYTTHTTKSFLTTVALLPAIVMTVILMVNGNLGVGVAVAGSFSLVRFRSLPGKANDIAVIFLSMATGLAIGMGYLTFALLIAVCISLLNVVLNKVKWMDPSVNYRQLKITIPEDLDYADIFDDILKEYTKEYRLTGVKTVDLGTMYLLCYDITLKDVKEEKKMMDALRCRNGNLTVSSLMQSNGVTEL